MTEVNEKTLPVHPAAEFFPLMQADELKKLAKDIKEHGLIDPILLYDGKLLDGRNRLKACEIAGMEPRYADAPVNGGSPIAFVVSKNLERRHLSISQRAAIGATMMPLLKKEAKERQRLGGNHGGHLAGKGRPKDRVVAGLPEPYPVQETDALHSRSREVAAKAVGVSPRTVGLANSIMERNPEEFQRVLKGEVELADAERKVMGERPSKHPPKPPSPGSEKRQQQRQQAARRTMIDVVSQIRGMCRGVKEMDIRLITSALSKEERAAFIAIGHETARIMRDFAHRLEAEK